MTTDPFQHYDAAYVLGALSPEDRHTFERHLEECPECARAVREVAGMPGLLAGAHPGVLEGPAPTAPDSVLDGALVRFRQERHRRRWRVGGAAGLAACAAAVVAVIVLVVLPTSGSAQTVAFSQVVPSPVHATAALQEERWGTRIDLDCSYDSGSGYSGASYGLVVTSEDGDREQVGTWWVAPGEDVSLTASTRVQVADIARVEIVGPRGTSLLRASP